MHRVLSRDKMFDADTAVNRNVLSASLSKYLFPWWFGFKPPKTKQLEIRLTFILRHFYDFGNYIPTI